MQFFFHLVSSLQQSSAHWLSLRANPIMFYSLAPCTLVFDSVWLNVRFNNVLQISTFPNIVISKQLHSQQVNKYSHCSPFLPGSTHSYWLSFKPTVDMTARHMSGVAPQGALVFSGLWCHSIGESFNCPDCSSLSLNANSITHLQHVFHVENSDLASPFFSVYCLYIQVQYHITILYWLTWFCLNFVSNHFFFLYLGLF